MKTPSPDPKRHDAMEDAYRRGRRDALIGPTSNPYPVGSALAGSYDNGFKSVVHIRVR